MYMLARCYRPWIYTCMNVKKLLHTRMRVSDLDETIRLHDRLGLEVLERKTSPRGSHLAFSKSTQ